LWGSVFGPGKRDGIPGHEGIELGLVRLYRATNEKRYLQLAQFFIEGRGQKPSFFEREYVGHAVRAMYLFSGMADVAYETGDQGLLEALDRLHHNVTTKRMSAFFASCVMLGCAFLKRYR
jgi:uncharacterized protein